MNAPSMITAMIAFMVLDLVSAAMAETPVAKPNTVIILSDDLGVECFSSYGGTGLKAPIIDKLATDGMRFTRYLAAC